MNKTTKILSATALLGLLYLIVALCTTIAYLIYEGFKHAYILTTSQTQPNMLYGIILINTIVGAVMLGMAVVLLFIYLRMHPEEIPPIGE